MFQHIATVPTGENITNAGYYAGKQRTADYCPMLEVGGEWR